MADLNNITIKLELKKKERTLQSTICEQTHMAHLQKLCIKPQWKSQTSIKQNYASHIVTQLKLYKKEKNWYPLPLPLAKESIHIKMKTLFKMPGQKRNKIEIINLNTTLTTKKKSNVSSLKLYQVHMILQVGSVKPSRL